MTQMFRREWLATCLAASAAFPASRLLARMRSDGASQIIEFQPQPNSLSPPVVTALSVHPSGRWLATAGDDHTVRIWRTNDGALVHSLTQHTDWVRTLEYSPDGRLLATAGNDRQIILWNAESGRLSRVLADHPQAIARLAISHDSGYLAAVGFEPKLRLYDLSSGRLAFELGCPCTDMRALAFSPDDNTVAGGGRNGRLRWWNVNTGRQLGQLDAHEQRIRQLSYSRDGALVFSCSEDRYVAAWDLVGGREAFRLPRCDAKQFALAVIDDRRLATAGSDNVIRIWDFVDRRELLDLRGHEGTIHALSAASGMLISGSYDTTVRIWTISGPTSGEREARNRRLDAAP